MSKVRVTTHVFPKFFSELVLHELDTRYSRETVSIAADSGDLPFGMVLTRNADGTYTALKETGGTVGDAHAVLIVPVQNAAESQPALILRGYCILNAANLAFDTSVTLKAEVFRTLRDRGFVIKEIPEDEEVTNNADA